jgi:isopenicillin-N N-acyltransferase-like protein
LTLSAGATPRAWGTEHGESYRGEIQSLAELRIYLTIRVGGFASESEVLACASDHLPILERFDASLYDELLGIADGADISPAEAVVVNHYTDLRDLGRGHPPADVAPGGCSIIYGRTPEGPVLAQTWDMHATAMPYVMMLQVPAVGGAPAMRLLTITGCLGMAGANSAGVGVAINNLHSADARVGVVWPALVRKALAARAAAAARDVVVGGPLGSGHHYLVADRGGAAFGIETSGAHRVVVYDGEAPDYVHTNHCLDATVGAASRVPPASTTYDRLAALERMRDAGPLGGLRDAWTRLGSRAGYPRSVCTNMATPDKPHAAATCGAVAANLATGQLWAVAGFVHNAEPERFDFEPEVAA